MTFNNGKEMLDEIQSGTDLYNPDIEQYVFCYNNKGSICIYNISNAYADKLKQEEQYWGAYLGPGGSIYDDPSYENYNENLISNLEWCEDNYKGEWEDVTK